MNYCAKPGWNQINPTRRHMCCWSAKDLMRYVLWVNDYLRKPSIEMSFCYFVEYTCNCNVCIILLTTPPIYSRNLNWSYSDIVLSLRLLQVSRLVVSEVVGRQNTQERVACIEKWAAIADICRCMHNYNGVLQICAAFVNSSVYRLKKTWEKLSKQVGSTEDITMQFVISVNNMYLHY